MRDQTTGRTVDGKRTEAAKTRSRDLRAARRIKHQKI